MIFLNASWGITPDKKRQPKLHAFIKRMHAHRIDARTAATPAPTKVFS